MCRPRDASADQFEGVARGERSQHRNKARALERLSTPIKLGSELAAITDRQETQAAHDRQERGRPVKRFEAGAFKAR